MGWRPADQSIVGPPVRENDAGDEADDDQVRDGEQPLDQDQAAGEVFGVVDVEVGRVVGLGPR